jgi:DNA-binding SARP family transcriptional activator
MRFRILGPLEVWSEGRWTAVSASKWRSLLACLLLRPGHLWSTESLILELWGDNPPIKANNIVSIYVHKLRRLIGDEKGRVLVSRAPGYLLRIEPGDLDTQEFESLVADGRSALAAADPGKAAELLAKALALWRGPLFADVQPTMLITTEAERAAELQLAAAELRFEADLACGRSAQVIPELRKLVAENPIRERLWLMLMRTLDEAGRHAEALEIYAQARQVIGDELGVDPGAELQRLYARLLAADAAAAAGDEAAADILLGEVPGTISIGTFAEVAPDPVAASAPPSPSAEGQAGPAMPRPSQLPADIGDFTGQEMHVRNLCDMLLQEQSANGPGAVRIAVVAGAAGLGKTTLAVHAAHQVRELFPDGQLYADLCGASARAAAPGEVLARFLRDLGVDGGKVPADEDERAALYRTRLTGRRVLVVLDNARDAAQVRPLLPGSASCAVLVTTRRRPVDLASTRFIDLNVLEDTDALALFSRIVGDERLAAEPDATSELLLACAGLPLAIRICAARLAARRHWKIATMAERLRDERRRLDEMKTGDLAVRASFQVSYDSLQTADHGPDPARVFRVLGLWEGPSVSLPAAAALLGEEEDDIAEALETLVDANLLESPAPDRYRFHDLLRFYATERAQAEEPAPDRADAVARLLRWYLATADAGATVVSPHRYRVPLAAGPDLAPFPLASVEDALGWFDSERENLLAAVRQAASTGLHDIAWRLGATLFPVFNRRDNWADSIVANRIGVDSARLAGHRQGEAWALQNLGQTLARLRDNEALAVLEQALTIRRDNGDHVGEAQTAVSLADAYHKLRGPQAALEYSLRSLELLRELGNAPVGGTGLNNHGEYCLELGRLDEAAGFFREAYDIWDKAEHYGKGHALRNLGRVHLESGRPDDAIASLTEARRIHLAWGDLIGEAVTSRYLGDACLAVGDRDAARQAWTGALAIFESLKAGAEADEIRFILSSSASLETARQEQHAEPGALSAARAEVTAALTPSAGHRDGDAAAGRPPDGERPVRDRHQEAPGDGHDTELIAVDQTMESAAEPMTAETGSDNRAAAGAPAGDDLTGASAPHAADETILAVLRTVLMAYGVDGPDQAAAYSAALIQSWPEAPGPPESLRETGGRCRTTPAETIPDAAGHELRPDPLTAKTAAEFIRALNQLRQWAGNPPFREMERRCGRAAASATICTALNGDKLPRRHIVLAIVTACGGDEEQERTWTTAWRKLEMEQEPPRRRGKQPAGRRLYPVPDTA